MQSMLNFYLLSERVIWKTVYDCLNNKIRNKIFIIESLIRREKMLSIEATQHTDVLSA